MGLTLHPHSHSHGHSHRRKRKVDLILIKKFPNFPSFSMGLTLHPHSHSHGHSHGKKKKKVEVDCEKLLVNSEDIQRSNGYQSYGSLPSQPASSHTEGHSHKDNINVKAAFVHVVGDLLQSIGVFVAALIIYFKVCLFIDLKKQGFF